MIMPLDEYQGTIDDINIGSGNGLVTAIRQQATVWTIRRTRTYGWEATVAPAPATTSRDENFELSSTFMFNSSSNDSLNMGYIVMNF